MLSLKFIKLFDILIEKCVKIDNQEEPPMILIFAKRRIIVEYMKDLVSDLIK